MYSCLVYDPPRGLFNIFNDSDEAIYVYLIYGNTDSLPLYPKLELFHYFSNDNMKDAYDNSIKPVFSSPEYRINAYTYGSIHIGGTRNNPDILSDENEVTLFFITEKTMRNHEWDEIYKNQMFVHKETFTKNELKKKKLEIHLFPLAL